LSRILTSIYLEPAQRKALQARAKRNRTGLSVEARKAIEAYNAGLSLEEFRLLDEATRKAARRIDEMIAVLDAGAARSKRFFAAIEKLRGARSPS
jgi:hypothetical protein